ncbi:MAG TPA: maleylpyruvate isomerase N-terminal domain-containing protein [Mycobacteriales bacterium]|jgi:hypothetical protein|nr:maleylpyruvate isomerase N-terminal domain-containing protein [Mycobacteriales bacterium]
MSAMNGGDVGIAIAEMIRVLSPHESADWTVPAGSLEWTCRATAEHVAHDLLAYAGQLAGPAGDGYLPFDLTIGAEVTPLDVLRVVTACGQLLRTAVDAAGPDVRAWHWGSCDPAGFAAMGVAEVLLHTYDITRGLDVAWSPPDVLCRGVLDRLVPDAPAGEPVAVLLWSTGRAELAGRPRRPSWVWKAALSDPGVDSAAQAGFSRGH